MTGEGDSFRASSPLVAPSTFAWFMGIPCLVGTEAQRFLAIVNARRATVVATVARQ